MAYLTKPQADHLERNIRRDLELQDQQKLC
jgi:hypothetical protein